jgi:peroxiredoxin
LGYQIIAISSDSPEDLRVTGEKQNLNYRLFSVGEGNLIKKIGIAFKSPERYSAMLFEN